MISQRLPPGWVVADSFSAQGAIVSVAAGAGVGTTAHQVLLQKEVASGARVFIEKIFLRVVDMAAYDQVFFGLRHNGALISPWNKISGEQIVEEFNVDVEDVFGAGMLEVVASNISGQTALESTAAPDAVAIRCIARFKGLLLRQRPLLRAFA